MYSAPVEHAECEHLFHDFWPQISVVVSLKKLQKGSLGNKSVDKGLNELKRASVLPLSVFFVKTTFPHFAKPFPWDQ